MTAVTSPAGAWREPPCGAVTRIEWSCHLGAAKAVDPYLIWADMTAFLGMGGWDETQVLHEGQLPLLLEFDSAPLGPGDDIAFGLLRIAGVYLTGDSVPGSTEVIVETRFKQLTALVQATQFGTLLLGSQHLVRYQLGLPRVPQIADRPPRLGDLTDLGSRRTVLGFIDDGCAFAHPSLADVQGLTRVEALWDQERPAQPADGDWKEVPFLGYGRELDREALLRACAAQPISGVAGPDPLAPYRRVDYLPTRLELGRTSLRREGVVWPAPVGAMRGSTHGSAVMDLAMGLPSPLRQRPSHLDPKGLEADRTLAELDRAMDWRAVFVQLPTATVADTSGGSLGYHVLDAVHYIVQRAQQVRPISPRAGETAPFADNPIVINISYGALAGAHDGGSIIEKALGALVGSGNSRLWVVVAAGNAHRAQGHARLRLRPGVTPCGRLVWSVPPDNPLESYLEIWLPSTDAEGGLVPRLANRLMLTLTPPGADAATLSLRVGQARALYEDDRGVRRLREEARCTAGAIFARRVAQTAPESTATMILLAVAPTRRPWPGDGPARAAGPAGDWSVELSLDPTSDVAVGGAVDLHAWAERSDQVFGLPRGQQSRVWADQPPPEPTEASPGAKAARRRGLHERGEQVHRAFEPRPTLGSLAGGRQAPMAFYDNVPARPGGHVVVVGAHRRGDGEMTADSSGGPLRPIAHDALIQAVIDGDAQAVSRLAGESRIAPDVDAPGDESAAVAGLAVNGTRSGLIGRVGATSAAAATVTRLIANSLTWKADSLGLSTPGAATPGSMVQADTARRRLLDAGLTNGEVPELPLSRRGTPTPTLDDAFRRGRQRAR